MNRVRVPILWSMKLFACAALVIALVIPAQAQLQTGNIFGRVVDSSGGPLPGVTVTLTGGGAPRTFVTDASGNFRFPSLSPGSYTLNAELAGLGNVTRSVDVNVGRNTDVRLALTPALEQTITVTAETPLLDVRRTGTGATITRVELDEVPTARDPWVILGQAPSVMLDRINVGGSESGQQSVFIGKGTDSDSNSFNVDGVTITDAGATGSSPTYYDFDMFEEMQVSTGGTDPRIGTPGVSLNMVTKRGTNDFRGSGRFYMTDNEWQADPEIPAEATSYLRGVNEIDRIEDWGAEIGGPIIRDRLWFWGAYGRNEIGILAAGSIPDFTLLENKNVKLNAQIVPNNSAVGFWTVGDKIKTGRGASPLRPPETTWNQSGPTEILKLEDTHIFGSNFFLTGLFSNVDGGFGLIPQGGLDTDMYYDQEGKAHGSFYTYQTERPQDQYRLDGSSFFDLAGMNHELKFGFGYRDTPVSSLLAYPGSGNYGYFTDETGGYAYLWRDGTPSYGLEQTELYVGDTILIGDLTLQAGLRWDRSSGINLASQSRANPTFPELLPAINFAGDDRELEFDGISPRLGATYAFGETRRSLVRAAYNRYTGTVDSSVVSTANAVPLAQFLLYYWTDANSNKLVEGNELGDFLFAYNVNRNNPASVQSTVRLDYDMEPTSTDEFLLGYEVGLMPELSVGVNYTHRVMDNFSWRVYEKTRGSGDFYTSADFVQKGTVSGTLPGGGSYTEAYYGLAQGRRSPFSVITNRPDFERTYDGFELVATKRMSNRWMMRVSGSWNDWKQEQGANSFIDPTNLLTGLGCQGRDCDGEVVAEQSTGSGAKGNIWLNSRWAYNITGVVQLPLNFSVGAAVTGREGYPLPFVHNVNVPDGFGNRALLINGVDPYRMEDIFNVDVRLANELRFRDVGVTLSAELFNATDERTILQRNRLMAQTAAQTGGPGGSFAGAFRIQELQSPRVIRFGARLSF